MGGSFDMLVSIQFFIAAFLWDVLARLLYLALTADFTSALLIWSRQDLLRGRWTPFVDSSGCSGLSQSVGFAAAAAWALFRKAGWRTPGGP